MNNSDVLQYDAILPAIRLGFARAMADNHVTPREMERKLADGSILGTAKEILAPIVGGGKNIVLLSIGGGALLGGLSGIARSDLEQRVKGNDDPEVASLAAKADGYQRMVRDLQDSQAASGTMPTQQPKRVQEAMR